MRAPRTHAALKFPIGARYSRHALPKPFVVCMTSNTPIAFLSKKLHSDGLLGNRTLLDVMHPSADVLTYKMRARQPVQVAVRC